jgi:hypothetical protein
MQKEIRNIVEHVADFKGEEKAFQIGQKDHRHTLHLSI